MGLDKAAQAVREAGYSRVPVYRESKDDVAGILYAKDLLRLKLSESENNASTLQELLRPAFFTPVNMELGELLEELRGRKLHMALCVDEYGAISGLVTMEDILEELFGEIYDEYDLEVRRWESMGEGVFMVSGKLGLHELEGLLGIRIVEEDCNTVAGLILKRLGHFPSQGEEVEAGMLKLRVEKVGPTRILAVRVQLTNQEEQ
jgi:CBS domain containing-hemolysin-like protein